MVFEISKLIPLSKIKENSVERLAGRCTGKTTALALKAISTAMLKPNEEVVVHHSTNVVFRSELEHTIKGVVEALGLEHISVTNKDCKVSLKYDILESYVFVDGKLFKEVA